MNITGGGSLHSSLANASIRSGVHATDVGQFASSVTGLQGSGLQGSLRPEHEAREAAELPPTPTPARPSVERSRAPPRKQTSNVTPVVRRPAEGHCAAVDGTLVSCRVHTLPLRGCFQ